MIVLFVPPGALGGYEIPRWLALGYATAIGVLIDLDHFVIARLRTGNWDAVRFCLSNPTAALADQRRIFDPGDVGVLHRLLSHLVLVGLVVPVVAFASVSLAVLTAGILYVHILSDVAWDLWRFVRYAESFPEELIETPQ